MARPKNPKYDGYAMEKFSNAVDTLAAGAGTVQKRLGEAYVYHLIRLKGGGESGADRLPPDRREKFRAFEAAMSIKDDPVRGRAMASAELMSDEDARSFAEYIVSTAFEIHRGWWMENGGD